ncbi:MAG: hypothetical protein AVDCRST_MAG69-1878 [uncultured Solirubrobacteraceae bacterium]|uniref:Uncharacterized protein n=1 Tax=uncultured Solirubrobacteraceae bacterium TaxID=1162706 RepID=A0A6J4SQ61_9ACTN|nr:MAG: hypothetical protein AVDCRST_MAG69-1878 [uncultured Solirubrobacteraceae bacterium]
MATTLGEVTFRLERLGWSAPERMEIVGRWAGVGPELVEHPTVIAMAAGVEHRFRAIGTPAFERNGGWAASFRWDPDITRISDVLLEFDSGLVLPLPHPSTHQRRFGRPLIKAHVAAVRTPPAHRPPSSDDHASLNYEDLTQLDLHAALIKAQQDLEEARDDLVDAEEQAAMARRDADRERERRRAEAERTREALALAGELAEEQLAAERTAAEERIAAERADAEQRISAERNAAEERIAAEQAAAAERIAAEQAAAAERIAAEQAAVHERFEREHATLTAERDDAQQQLQVVRQEAEELSGKLEQVSDTLAVERIKRSGLREEVDALRSDLDRAGRREREVAERHTAEVAGIREELEVALGQLESAREDLSTAGVESRRRDEELERLRGRLLEIQPVLDENARLTGELAEMRRHVADLEPLREQLAELSRHAAQVEPLREQLAEARSDAEQATADAAMMRERLEAIGRALGEVSR